MLIGREHERQRLVELLEPAPAPNGNSPDTTEPTSHERTSNRTVTGVLRLIHVDGPIGIGKSSLISSVMAGLHARTFFAQGDRMFLKAPLAAHRVMIETLLDETLETLLHETTPQAISRRCLDALENTPTVLVIDDAQWLDGASEDFLIGLLQAPSHIHLTIVLVHRLGQEPTRIIAQARRRGALHDHITLRALPDTVITELVAELDEHQRHAVLEVANGNPLFARTALAAFRRHPEARHIEEVLRLAGGTRSAVLSAAVADDVASLPAEYRRLLEAIAVLGNTHLAATSAASVLSAETCRAGIALLQQHGLVSTNQHESIHPVIRFSVYQQTDPARKRRAHRIAAQLEGVDLLERAEHLAQLGADLTESEAHTLNEAAALTLGTDPRSVLRWLSQVPHQFHTLQFEILMARAEILNGEIPAALARLRPLAAETPDSVEIKVLLANVLRMSHQPEEARALLASEPDDIDARLLREMVDVIALVDDGVSCELLDKLASMPGEENRVIASIYHTMDLLARGEVRRARSRFLGVPEWLVEAPAETFTEMLHAVACAVWCAYLTDEFTVGVQLATRGLQVARGFGRADVFANLNTGLAFCLVQLGRLDEADTAAEQAIDDAARFGSPELDSMAKAALVLTAFSPHAHDTLSERYAELKRAQLPKFSWWRRAVQGILIRASAIIGEPESATPLFGMPRDAMTGMHFADAAFMTSLFGDPASAEQLVHEGLTFARAEGIRSQEALLKSTLAEILLGTGDSEQLEHVRSLLKEARSTYRELSMGMQFGRVSALLARAESALARSEDPLAKLTPREQQVARLIADGLTNREIATRLVISPRTAEEHASKIKKKLDVPTRAAIGALLPAKHQPVV